MDDILDRYLDETLLTEEERRKVQQLVSDYDRLDMNLFINRIGGAEKIEEMRRINDKADRMYVVDGVAHYKSDKSNGVVHHKSDKSKEDIEEWKKGFMDGFEEAYKRLNMK